VSGKKGEKIGFITVISILSLDQLSKFLITKNLLLDQSMPVIKGIFHLTLIHNRGAAFGILKNQTNLFILTALFAIVLSYFGLKDQKHKRLYRLSLNLMLAGALGNLIDRLFFGYVIDFLDFRIWPVFNIADSAITIGAILLGIFILSQKSKPQVKS
jgi:signal peptidase II